MASFELNKKAIDQLGRDAVRAISKDIERDNNRYLNGLSARMHGQPLDAIEAELRRHYRGKIDLDTGTVREWASVIHEGGHFNISFRVK